MTFTVTFYFTCFDPEFLNNNKRNHIFVTIY
jgi:hypothetical protein